MPYVRVHIDADDVLDELSIEELEAELKSRKKRSGFESGLTEIPAIVASETLEEAALILRRSGHYSLAYKLDEIRVDHIQPNIKTNNNYRWKPSPEKMEPTNV